MTATDYHEFIAKKLAWSEFDGIEVDSLPDWLFPHQKDLTRWALRKGRAATFASTGLGKTRIQVAWADVVAKHTGGKVLILAPLAVAEQTVEEAREVGIVVAHCREGHDAVESINITNYERLHKFDTSQFVGVVLDECFSADTLIDCATGRKPIKDIRKGDKILNASGADLVADIHRREVPYGIKVKSQGQHFIASPNHPIFTQRGWVGAQDLCPGDYALATGAAMSLVRSSVFPKEASPERSAILRDILLSEMANEHAGAQGESPHAGDVREDSCKKQDMESFGFSVCRERTGSNQEIESYIQDGCEREDIPHVESHEPQTFRAWGEWDWADGTSGVHDGCSWRRMDTGICFVTGPTSIGLSNELQDRLGKHRAENRHRTGWELTLLQESKRREEGLKTSFIRLDGIEVLEQGHPELERLRDADGKLYFYDIGATRHPSFSVNGILVHNSSIIKHDTSKTLKALLDAFALTPYKLCATATPAPNDWTELGTHAEFLGIRSSSEMLAEFFVHDGGETQTWRLKGHARREFWRWVATWGAMIRSPEDLGHDGSLYELPPLNIQQHTVDSVVPYGQLFAIEAQTLSDRRTARRESIELRVKACADIVNSSDDIWIVWCDLNAEGDALRAAIPGSVEVRGSDSIEDKERRLLDFAHGKTRVLISKPSICGFGMNLQVCHNMAFVGVTDSFEAYYQAIRRCWRFGQSKPVNVHIFASESEGSVIANLARKESDAQAMQEALAAETLEAVRDSVLGGRRETNEYKPSKTIIAPSWLVTETMEKAA